MPRPFDSQMRLKQTLMGPCRNQTTTCSRFSVHNAHVLPVSYGSRPRTSVFDSITALHYYTGVLQASLARPIRYLDAIRPTRQDDVLLLVN